MHRLYLLIPDLDRCRELVQALRATGIDEPALHVVASHSQRLEALPEAGVWQTTELARGIELGIGLGGVAGLLGGLLAVSFPPAGLVIGGGAVLASTAAGAGFGSLVSAMMKSHQQNHHLHDYHEAIAAGKILLLVDVHGDQDERIRALITELFPQAEINIALLKDAG